MIDIKEIKSIEVIKNNQLKHYYDVDIYLNDGDFYKFKVLRKRIYKLLDKIDVDRTIINYEENDK